MAVEVRLGKARMTDWIQTKVELQLTTRQDLRTQAACKAPVLKTN